MNRPGGKWLRFVYKQIVPGDILKLFAESNKADTGGGARDLRFSPYDKFWPVFQKMFDVVPGRKYLDASLIWENGVTTKTEVYPPTASRPNETRITKVNSCCPKKFVPAGLDACLFILVQSEDGVYTSFMTKAEVFAAGFTHRLERFLISVIEYTNLSKTPMGYVDIEDDQQYSMIGEVLNMSHFQPYFKREDVLAAIRTKPFILLAGISGTGKSRMVRELARGTCPRYVAGTTTDHPLYDEKKPGNFKSIAVRPNWHDSTELLGYVSRITGSDVYQVTDFVKFLCSAWRYEQEGVPFFLCLDEMNLAPVEQYFAEYLSMIESRQKVGGKIVTDPLITFKNDAILGQVVTDVYPELSQSEQDKYFNQFKAAGGIPIPSNLVVMGTVNMDETTFSFSRKVLDRAMSFELNEVDMKGGLTQNPNIGFGSLPESTAKPVLVKGHEAYAESDSSKDICDKVVAYLTEINGLLDGTPFKIAYRTRDEAMIYCIERLRVGTVGLAQALDEITSMKILSRIEGDSLRLAPRESFVTPTGAAKPKTLLGQLRLLIVEGLKKVDPNATEELYPVCAKKLTEMERRLKGGFTGFWQ